MKADLSMMNWKGCMRRWSWHKMMFWYFSGWNDEDYEKPQIIWFPVWVWVGYLPNISQCYQWVKLFSNKWVTCGSHMTVLHHITVVKCLNSCQKTILDWLQTWNSSSLACMFTWFGSSQFICGDILKYWQRDCEIELNNFKVKYTLGIFICWQVSFFFFLFAEVSCLSKNILRTSCKKIKIKRLLMAAFFLFLHNNLLNSESI